MKRKILSIALCSTFLAILTGCATGDEYRQSTGTTISLAGNNYKLIKAGAAGHSSGFRLLMVIPFASPTIGGAKTSLYKSAGIQETGKAMALANYTEDRTTLYLILFSIPKITVTADVIEFTDAPTSGSNTSK